MPSHQFGFRKEHRTIPKAYRLVSKINNGPESTRYCSAAFIDITQALDKVWHTRLLYKLKRAFKHQEYTLLKSYLTGRTFQARYHKNTLNSILSNVEYHKAIFSDPYFIQYLQQTYQKPSKHRQQPTPMTQRF